LSKLTHRRSEGKITIWDTTEVARPEYLKTVIPAPGSTGQPVFTELFAYDPVVPSQLPGKWWISSQLDGKLQPLRVGVVEDPIGKTVGRVTVQEGDGLEGASEATAWSFRRPSSRRPCVDRRSCTARP
jgi:hypothetical protein